MVPTIYPCKTWITTTDLGSAVLTIPAYLTPADVDDLEEWMALIMRSLRRMTVEMPQAADAVATPSRASEG